MATIRKYSRRLLVDFDVALARFSTWYNGPTLSYSMGLFLCKRFVLRARLLLLLSNNMRPGYTLSGLWRLCVAWVRGYGMLMGASISIVPAVRVRRTWA